MNPKLRFGPFAVAPRPSSITFRAFIDEANGNLQVAIPEIMKAASELLDSGHARPAG